MKTTKIYFTAIFVFLFHISGKSSLPDEIWVPNVKVELYSVNNQFIMVSPNKYVRIKGNVTFSVDGKTYRPKYIPEREHYVFDSLPFKKGEIKLSSKGYESQKYKILPQTTRVLTFHLGKPGCSYMARGEFKYPYYEHKGFYGIIGGKNYGDSIESFYKPYMDSIGCEYHSIDTKKIVHVRCSQNRSDIEIIKGLLKIPNVKDAGELTFDGIMTSELTVTFQNAGKSDIRELLNKYNLIELSSSGVSYRVKVSKYSNMTAPDVGLKMINEPKIKYVSNRIINYLPPPVDH